MTNDEGLRKLVIRHLDFRHSPCIRLVLLSLTRSMTAYLLRKKLSGETGFRWS